MLSTGFGVDVKSSALAKALEAAQLCIYGRTTMKKLMDQSAFTIIELMVVVVVLGIVLAVGIPSFRSLIQDYRLVTKSNDISHVLQFARAEAVRLGGGVKVSALNNDVDNGFRIWVDRNGNNGVNDGEELRVLNVEQDSLALTADIGGTNTQNVQLEFNARGESGLANTLSLELCDGRSGNHGRTLELLVSGSMRMQKGTACAN
ncbi:GspH/FimT family protein [Microbulbifer aggregans]|uniref:GspH/FimT family protein n=1 Tax=Microbulbifer aggregans TaxID=1769779 RepID=UPI001CFEEB16|nr:GspH/FimT family protein [Microbulbifer aggregans]